MYSILDPEGILSVHEVAAQNAVYADFPEDISPLLLQGLKKTGIQKLYSHQAQAMQLIMKNDHVIVTSSTASGKSIIYTLPVLNDYLKDPQMTALYLTPAKALGQNQLKTMQDIKQKVGWPGPAPEINVCDGDTEYGLRKPIMQKSNLVITTVDMLHYNLLPQHNHWHRFFKRLKYVIIDEGHIYRGIFGCHVCHVFRRLRRICAHYKSNPVFIICTATLSNPREFAMNLVGLDIKVIDRDTSPSGIRQVVFYLPPAYKTKGGELRRRLTHYEAARALGRYVERNNRVIVFGRSRKVVESMFRKLKDEYPGLKDRVTAYKGTYNQELRRQLENRLFTGALRGVITTNALELGIDVGDLDVCILAGFPGSIASTWQQGGRVGRKGQKSLLVFMASEDPLDIFLVSNPGFFFGQPFEKAIVSPDKSQFLAQHVLLAAHELPLKQEDKTYWNEESYYDAVKKLACKGDLRLVSDQPKFYKNARPPQKFSLRGESDNYQAVDKNGTLLEHYDYADVLLDCYPGAILFSMGTPYMVEAIDQERKIIRLARLPKRLLGYKTRSVINTCVKSKETAQTNDAAKIPTHSGTLVIESAFAGYYLVSPDGEQNLCRPAFKMRPYTMQTTGLWFHLRDTHEGVVHALEHLLRIVIPLYVMCERNDIGTHFEDGCLYVYDHFKGDAGFTTSVLDNIDQVLSSCLDVLINCGCKEGCPKCLHIGQCTRLNDGLDKKGTTKLLQTILGN